MIREQITRMIRTIKERSAAWYEGEHLPDDPASGFVILPGNRPSLGARAVRGLITFWEAHWQWCIPVGLSIIFGLRHH
jgi:hypothetical protein